MSLSEEILLFLEEFGELLPRPFESKYAHVHRVNARNFRQNYYQTVSRLSKRGLIAKNFDKQKSSYVITRKGRKLLEKKAGLKKRRDGLATIIIFDIPEEKSKVRRSFRKFLLKNGFISIQKSSFIGVLIINKYFKSLIKELGIEKNVRVISGKLDNF